MNAGREMDALVAEKVMGWSEQPTGYIDRAYEAKGEWEPFFVWCDWLPGHVVFRTRASVIGDWKAWSPSTDIAAAWEVVEIAANGRRPIITKWFPGGNPDIDGWAVSFTKGAADFTIAEIAPIAICRAALKAVGVEV